MEGGTRVVHSADGDIKRPICAGIDVHKEILMAAVCKTDTGDAQCNFLRQEVHNDEQRHP